MPKTRSFVLSSSCRCWHAPVLIAALVSAGSVAPLAGQQSFRAGVDLTRLDVAVLDERGHPVTDLSQSDFTLLIDGAPRRVETFARVDVPAAPPASARPVWADASATDVATNAMDHRRLFVLVMDDAMIIDDIPMSRGAVQIARDVVDRLGPDDLMAIVFTRDNRGAQDFTSDKAKLRAAIAHFSPGTAYMDPSSFARSRQINTDAYAYSSSLHTLKEAADALIAIPDRRKALVYIGEGVPVDPEQAATVGMGHGDENSAIQRNLIADMQELFRRAQRANVAIYGFDPSPVGFEDSLTSFLMQHTTPAAAAMLIAHDLNTLSTDFMEAVASNTGGRATLKLGAAPAAIDQMFGETGSYYLLGYQAGAGKPGEDHRIEVRINRPGKYDVRARSRYRQPDASESRRLDTDPNAAAIAGLIPSAGLALDVAAMPFADPTDVKKGTVALAIDIGVPKPSTRTDEALDLVIRAFTPEGSLKATHNQTIHVAVLPGEAGETARFQVLSWIQLDPGRYELRIGLRNAATAESGSVYVDAEVPDFAKQPLSLSGLAISVDATGAVPQALEAVLSAPPTTRRRFGRTDRVSLHARGYAGSKTSMPVTVTTRVLDASGATVFEQPQTRNADGFSGTARVVVIDQSVPIDHLSAGPYLLVLRATAAGVPPAERRVPFEIH